jgi:photosystem II stability/assembly factor-like uncharacterized protein
MTDMFHTDRRTLLSRGAAAAVSGLFAAPAIAAAPKASAAVWQKLPTEPYAGKQDDIAFGSPSRGWFGNGKGLLYRTDDGGDSWRKVWEQPGTFIRALGFFDENTGILGNVGVGSFPGVTDTHPLYRTADGGMSWSKASIAGPQPGGICAVEIVRSFSIDRGERAERTIAHAAGRVGGPAHHLRSVDGGKSWTSQDLSSATAAIFDIKFLNAKTGFIAGSSSPELGEANGLILRTDDGGESWRPVFRSGRGWETVWKVHFPTPLVGYGSIQSYDPDPANTRRFVVKTADGGRTWSELPLVDNAKWRSFGIGFATERLGWVGGNLGGLETRDGGKSWAPAELGVAVNKIRFVGRGANRRAFAIGKDVHRLAV